MNVSRCVCLQAGPILLCLRLSGYCVVAQLRGKVETTFTYSICSAIFSPSPQALFTTLEGVCGVIKFRPSCKRTLRIFLSALFTLPSVDTILPFLPLVPFPRFFQEHFPFMTLDIYSCYWLYSISALEENHSNASRHYWASLALAPPLSYWSCTICTGYIWEPETKFSYVLDFFIFIIYMPDADAVVEPTMSPSAFTFEHSFL